MPFRTDLSATRRRVLTGLVGVTLAGGAGCLGTPAQQSPVPFDDGWSCDQCGMTISQQPGPVGQTYYADEPSLGHDGPARFCSSLCTYRHRFDTETRGWTPSVTYLTDYSTVDYSVRSDGDGRSSHHTPTPTLSHRPTS
ncbi:nitrous oxide reductase accessory protein NosL [Halomicroarcula sp. GCM10025709]|uniref:nitrous oxide reductase accessory protein NosL n=1 Tax=Halomicroarcula sp. GCM10025709 TaxID=3252669 RepID=UPI00361B2B66